MENQTERNTATSNGRHGDHGTTYYRLTDAIAAQLGERYWPDRCSLETYQVYNPKQKEILARLRALKMKTLVENGRGLIFFGFVGTGKDHLMAALLYHAASLGISAQWMNGQAFYGASRDRMDSGESERRAFAELLTPEILAISDPVPPAGNLSAWNVSQLYRLIDERYRALKPTWASLNATNEADADKMLSAPVWDRLRENAEMFPCFWQSFRERQQK